jgi:hypothetical protein
LLKIFFRHGIYIGRKSHYDRPTYNYWSHGTFVPEWKTESKNAIGAEVTWEHWQPDFLVPERNGVTLFPLSRYFDEQHSLNL